MYDAFGDSGSFYKSVIFFYLRLLYLANTRTI